MESPRLRDDRGRAPPSASAAAVRIDCYTDPLCVWSWATEATWRRLRYEFGEGISWRIRLGGMIADWSRFGDPLNDVRRPLHMGPHWYHVRKRTGVPLDERIWLDDPPGSSYPACIGVKAAGLQSAQAAEAYLRRVREAVLLERRNVARREVLLDLATEIAGDEARPFAWSLERFVRDLDGPAAQAAFREDLQDTRYREIGRFPSLVVRPRRGRAVLLVGSRPHPDLRRALAHVAPGLRPVRAPDSIRGYVLFWGRVTAHEVATAFELEPREARELLEREVAEGGLSTRGAAERALYTA